MAWQTKIGGVVWQASARHGVHTGDVLAFLVAGMWAAHSTLAIYRRPRRGR